MNVAYLESCLDLTELDTVSIELDLVVASAPVPQRPIISPLEQNRNPLVYQPPETE